MTLDTLKHVRAMQETAMALEQEARANGRYSHDCGRVNDAIVRGMKSGVALLWGQDGKMEIVDLNNGSAHVRVMETGDNGITIEHDFPTWNKSEREEQRRDETNKITGETAASPYEQVGGEVWERAKAKSHEPGNKTAGKFKPAQTTGDAARLARELKATQDRNSAKERSIRADGIARNERIAQQMKEASNKQWGNGRIA